MKILFFALALLLPAFCFSQNKNAIDVIKIGRRRRLTACNVDSIIGMPLSTLSFAYSTIRIAFFADKPIKVIKPICAYTLFVKRGIKVSVNIAPNTPIGTASKTENGTA